MIGYSLSVVSTRIYNTGVFGYSVSVVLAGIYNTGVFGYSISVCFCKDITQECSARVYPLLLSKDISVLARILQHRSIAVGLLQYRSVSSSL